MRLYESSAQPAVARVSPSALVPVTRLWREEEGRGAKGMCNGSMSKG